MDFLAEYEDAVGRGVPKDDFLAVWRQAANAVILQEQENITEMRQAMETQGPYPQTGSQIPLIHNNVLNTAPNIENEVNVRMDALQREINERFLFLQQQVEHNRQVQVSEHQRHIQEIEDKFQTFTSLIGNMIETQVLSLKGFITQEVNNVRSALPEGAGGNVSHMQSQNQGMQSFSQDMQSYNQVSQPHMQDIQSTQGLQSANQSSHSLYQGMPIYQNVQTYDQCVQPQNQDILSQKQDVFSQHQGMQSCNQGMQSYNQTVQSHNQGLQMQKQDVQPMQSTNKNILSVSNDEMWTPDEAGSLPALRDGNEASQGRNVKSEKDRLSPSSSHYNGQKGNLERGHIYVQEMPGMTSSGGEDSQMAASAYPRDKIPKSWAEVAGEDYQGDSSGPSQAKILTSVGDTTATSGRSDQAPPSSRGRAPISWAAVAAKPLPVKNDLWAQRSNIIRNNYKAGPKSLSGISSRESSSERSLLESSLSFKGTGPYANAVSQGIRQRIPSGSSASMSPTQLSTTVSEDTRVRKASLSSDSTNLIESNLARYKSSSTSVLNQPLIKYIPKGGAVFKIAERSYTKPGDCFSKYYYCYPSACRVRLCLNFNEEGHLTPSVRVSKGILDELYSWPIIFQGNGMIYNFHSEKFTDILEIPSQECRKPENKEEILDCKVSLKTNRFTYDEVTYQFLEERCWAKDGSILFKWNVEADEKPKEKPVVLINK